MAADNLKSTAAVLHPGVNGAAASERVQFAFTIPAGTTTAGVTLRFDNVALSSLQAGVLPNVSIVAYADGVATGEQWTSSQLLNLRILQSTQQTDVTLAPAPSKSFNQLELQADGAVNAYTLNFFAAFGPSPGPLPVQLVSFAATAAPGSPAVQLTWTTASDVTSAYFVVERSLDGIRFAAAGQVAAAGTSATARTYTYVDAGVATGLLYYRLRQVDQDGTTSYSCVRPCACSPSGTVADLALFPTPARDQATLAGARPGADVQLLDALGRLVLRTTADKAGATHLQLPAGLTPGVYVVRTGSQTARLSVGE